MIHNIKLDIKKLNVKSHSKVSIITAFIISTQSRSGMHISLFLKRGHKSLKRKTLFCMNVIWSFYLRVGVKYEPSRDLLNHKLYWPETLQAITQSSITTFEQNHEKLKSSFLLRSSFVWLAFHNVFSSCCLIFQPVW